MESNLVLFYSYICHSKTEYAKIYLNRQNTSLNEKNAYNYLLYDISWRNHMCNMFVVYLLTCAPAVLFFDRQENRISLLLLLFPCQSWCKIVYYIFFISFVIKPCLHLCTTMHVWIHKVLSEGSIFDGFFL